MDIQLTSGAVAMMLGGDMDITPILQIKEIRLVTTSNNQGAGNERYRMVLSDGIHIQQGMLATQRNELVHAGNLKKGSVVKLLQFVCNYIQGRPIIIVIDLEVLMEVCEPIGQPTQYVLPGGTAPVQAQPVADQSRTRPVNPQYGNVIPPIITSAANPSSVGGALLQHPSMERGPEVLSYVNASHTNTGSLASTNAASPHPRPGFGYGNSVGSTAMERGPEVPSYVNASHTNTGSLASTNAAAPQQRPGFGYGKSVGSTAMERGPEVPSYVNASHTNTGRLASTNAAASPHPRPGFGYGNSVGSTAAGGSNNYRTEVVHSPIPSHPPYGQPPPMYMNRGPTARNEPPTKIIPIAALNPYQGRWTIKARVTAKGELRTFNNNRGGDGKVFSFDLLDSDGGEIRVTCFNDVADKFFNVIVLGGVYLISKGNLKPAKKQYNHLPNDYEISLESTSVVQPCSDDDNSIPRQQFNFHSISEVEGFENNKIVDIIALVSSVNPTSTIMLKNSKETQKRTLQLKDQSGKSVELVLWGSFCNAEGEELQKMCNSGLIPVLAVKSARVNDFIGKAVGTLSTSQLIIDPDFPEALALKEWFEREGRNTPCVSISRDGMSLSRTDVRKTISQIKDEKLGTFEKPDYITVSANITYMKVENFCYTACPLSVGDRKCSKKVTNNGDGKWHCDKCDQVVDECEYRYILQCQIQDHTGQTWITAFQEWGEEIMGITAKELYYMKYEEQDDAKFSSIISGALFTKFIFKLKVKEETYSDEQRVKSTVVKADRVNFLSETKFLQDLLSKMILEGSNAPPSTVNGQPTQSTISYGGNPYFSGGASGVSGNQMRSNISYGNTTGFPGGASGVSNGAPQNNVPSYPVGNTSGGMYVSCSSCGGSGHSSADCPSVMSGTPGHITGGYVGRTPSGPAMSSVPPAYGMQKQHLGGY